MNEISKGHLFVHRLSEILGGYCFMMQMITLEVHRESTILSIFYFMVMRSLYLLISKHICTESSVS